MSQYTSLVPLLDDYLDGLIPLYELRGQFDSGQIQPADEAEEGRYQAVSMHLAMFSVGTWAEGELKAAIQWHMASKAGVRPDGFVPMIDKQWLEIMSSGMAPWPLKVEGKDKEPT